MVEENENEDEEEAERDDDETFGFGLSLFHFARFFVELRLSSFTNFWRLLLDIF